MPDVADIKKYEISAEQRERIDKNFSYHSPSGDQVNRYPAIRAAGAKFARLICEATPQSDEQSVALTKLEEAVMWANAAIARNEGDDADAVE